jgi:hypothetical protein
MERVKIKVIILLVILITITALSCKTTSTGPIDEKTPGRRDYTWTVDTINAPLDYLWRIWGTSPKDLWAVARGSESQCFVWHYNGEKWSTVDILKYGYVYPGSIYGFDKTNIYIAGDDGRILNGDGNTWKLALNYNPSEYLQFDFRAIWGDSPDNIYTVGTADSLANNIDYFIGIIMHFDGTSWERVTLPTTMCQFRRIVRSKGHNSNYYILGHYWNDIRGETKANIYEFDGKKLNEIYSNPSKVREYMGLINGEVLFVLNKKICIYNNGVFKTVRSNEEIEKGYCVGGRNRDDLFFIMEDGIAHYNGSDLTNVFKSPEGMRIVNLAVFEKEIFFVANGLDGSNYIIKGKLK